MKFNPQKDYYTIMGVSPNADAASIQRAYRELVNRYHPDKHQGNALEDLARDKLIEVNEAYEVLSKPGLKADYDAVRRHRSGANADAPPYSGGNYCAPRNAPKMSKGSLRQLVFLIALFAATPILFRFIRSPRVAIVIAIAVLIAWFGPRLLKRLKK